MSNRQLASPVVLRWVLVVVLPSMALVLPRDELRGQTCHGYPCAPLDSADIERVEDDLAQVYDDADCIWLADYVLWAIQPPNDQMSKAELSGNDAGAHHTGHATPDMMYDAGFLDNPPPLGLLWVGIHESAHHNFGADEDTADYWANGCTWGFFPPSQYFVGDERDIRSSLVRALSSTGIASSDYKTSDDTVEVVLLAARALTDSLMPGVVAVTWDPDGRQAGVFQRAVAQGPASMLATDADDAIKCEHFLACELVNADVLLHFAEVSFQGSGVATVRLARSLPDRARGRLVSRGFRVQLMRDGLGWRITRVEVELEM